MALTVVDEPGYISASKNPIEFHLRSPHYVNQQPTVGVWELTFTSKLTTLGAYHLFEFDGNSVQMYVESTTTPNGYNLPQDITSTTLNQYVDALVDTWFPAQYLLEKYFIIEYVTAATVRFTAKSADTTLTITTTTPGGEATWSTATTPISMSTLDDYSVIMDIEVEEVYGSDEWTRIGTLHADPILYDDSGTWKGDVKFDVHEILDGFLQTREDSPTLSASIPTIADNTNLQWRAIYAERYTVAGEVVIVRRVQTDVYRVIKGGLDYRDYPTLWDMATSVYGVTDKPFNSWQPLVRQVTLEESHFLYFLTDHALVSPQRFHLKATVYYADGSTQNATLMSGDTQQQWETFYYRCGFNDEGLDALSTETPYKYEVWIENTSQTVISEVRTFWLALTTRQDRFFMYENSMQGWNTLRTTGEHRALPNAQKTEGKKVVQKGYTATEHNTVQKSNGYTDGFEVSIGPKWKDEFAALRDFMNSERHYEIIDGVKVPIVVDTAAMKLEYERTGSYAFIESFKYRFAFINKGYSHR